MGAVVEENGLDKIPTSTRRIAQDNRWSNSVVSRRMHADPFAFNSCQNFSFFTVFPFLGALTSPREVGTSELISEIVLISS